jgi:DNA polymerase-3 subunit delta
MASGPPRRSDAPTVEQCLAEIRAGRPAAVYLLDGDPFLTLRAARRMAEALVPEAQRSLNAVELDAAASPAEVAAELSTAGLFGGAKAVLLVEPAFLQAKEDAAEAFERARQMWSDGRQREAARRLLALAAKAGWSAADLDPARDGAASPAAWKRELGIDVDEAARSFLADAARFALERDMKAARDDASALDALLGTGLPPGRVLIVAAGKVDGRLPLVKKLAAAGRRLGLAVEKEGQWDAQRPVLGPVIASLLAGSGKSLDRGAESRLAELVGDDARVLAAEVAKLATYVGERKVIGAADVEEVVARVAPDPFFALGNAVEARHLEAALGVLGRSLADGASPHMLLGSLAATARRLLVERERGRAAAGERRLGSFQEWSAVVLPQIPAEEMGDRKPFGFWMKYQAAMRFSREELLDALAGLAEADRAMKSGGDGGLLLERSLWRFLARERLERRTA